MITENLPRLSVRPNRRDVLKNSAALAGALVVATYIPMPAFAEDAPAAPKLAPVPNAFIRIAPDDTVTVIVKHLDMGQGVTTGLATIVAEELDADWGQMRSEFAPANAALYANLAFGMQGTGGSTSIANSWMQLRLAAAAARAMLVAAAAAEWNVPASEITVGSWSRRAQTVQPDRTFRSANGGGGSIAGASKSGSEGSEGLPPDRVTNRAAARHAGQDHRQDDLCDGCETSEHGVRRTRPCAEIWRNREIGG